MFVVPGDMCEWFYKFIITMNLNNHEVIMVEVLLLLFLILFGIVWLAICRPTIGLVIIIVFKTVIIEISF